MQLFDYLANYLQITWLIDLQLMNKHGRRSTPVTTVFCWRQTNLFDLSDHSQETPSHATSRYRPGSKNLLIHKQKSPPSQTLEIFIRHTSQLLFLISSITKMLVFWDVKKKKLPGLTPQPATDTQSFGGTRSCFSQLHWTYKENSSWVIWPRTVVLSFNVDSVLQCDQKHTA